MGNTNRITAPRTNIRTPRRDIMGRRVMVGQAHLSDAWWGEHPTTSSYTTDEVAEVLASLGVPDPRRRLED